MGSDNFFTSFAWGGWGGIASLSLSSGAVLEITPPYRAGPTSSRQDDGIEILRARALDKDGCV